MDGSFTMVRRALLGLACAASLGFGTAQAFAEPGMAARAPLCTPSDPAGSDTRCNRDCRSRGYAGGLCDDSYTWCSCYTVPPPIDE
jgi:hypothetical protein